MTFHCLPITSSLSLSFTIRILINAKYSNIYTYCTNCTHCHEDSPLYRGQGFCSEAASPNRVSIRMMDGAPDWEGYYSHYNKWRRGARNFDIDAEEAISFSLLLEAPPTVLLQVSHFQLMIILINIHLDFRVWQTKMKALEGSELWMMNIHRMYWRQN